MGSCFGFLHILNKEISIPFSAYEITEGNSLKIENHRDDLYSDTLEREHSDWLSIGIPVALLKRFFQVDESWISERQPWLVDLCEAFANVADHVHSKVPIWTGAIGEEISGSWRRPTEKRQACAVQDYPPLALMSANVIETRGGVLLSQDIWNDLKSNVEPVVLPSGLLYVPPRPNAPLLGA